MIRNRDGSMTPTGNDQPCLLRVRRRLQADSFRRHANLVPRKDSNKDQLGHSGKARCGKPLHQESPKTASLRISLQDPFEDPV